MNLSIFKHRTTSGYIRGQLIGEYLGAKLNPESGYEKDVCIWIKWTPATKVWGKRYLDIVDNHKYLKWLKENEDCACIAISKSAEKFLKSELKNEIVYIPQQHVNYERTLRATREVSIVGYCGEYWPFQPFEEEIRSKLKNIGLELKTLHKYRTRFDVIEFYKSIDIQIVWRNELGYLKPLKNPIKLSNAGSFGIPTVAYPEENFVEEWLDCFVETKTIDQLISQVRSLKESVDYYKYFSDKAWFKSNHYHVEKVAQYYERLVSDYTSKK